MRWLLGVGLGLGVAGCLTEAGFRSDVLPRASFEFGCPASRLTVSDLGEGTWGVAGCGKKAVYVFVPRMGYVNNTGIEREAPPPSRTAAIVAAPTHRAEDFVVVPLRATLLRAHGDAGTAFGSELPRIVAQLDLIMEPAAVYFALQGPPDDVELPAEVPWRFQSIRAALPPSNDDGGFHVFFVRDLDVNGAGIGGGALVVQERPGLRQVPGLAADPVARVMGHLLGRALGLSPVRDERHLMALSTTGFGLDVASAATLHAAAKTVRGARTFDDAVRSGEFPGAVAAIRARSSAAP